MWQSMGTQDIHWSEEALVAGKKFLNKIWNATRFVLFTAEGSPTSRVKALTNADKEILKKLKEIVKKTNKNIDNFEFGQTLHELYDFFWHDFCDVYIEKSKTQTQNPILKENTQKILIYTLAISLKLLHPFIPHITEEIWSRMPREKSRGKMLIIEKWPIL
jgi:valyl-tRNA synthetase